MHVNKVHHVTTINRVAEDLGEDEDWLRDVANEMEIEDGAIWVYCVEEHGIQAFTDFGIENLIELVRMYKEQNNPMSLRPTPDAYDSPSHVFEDLVADDHVEETRKSSC
jgi:hypothetical protein